MARVGCLLMAFGFVSFLTLGCDMPWDKDNGKGSPDPPEVRAFVVTNTGNAQGHNLNERDNPRVTI